MFPLPDDKEFKVTSDYVRQRVKAYLEADDVFHSAFLATVVFYGAEADVVTITTDARECLDELGAKRIINTDTGGLLPGPYALVGNQLKDVWKLIDDSNGTCMVTLKPQSKYTKAFSVNHGC